jgi:hypothetical protein
MTSTLGISETDLHYQDDDDDDELAERSTKSKGKRPASGPVKSKKPTKTSKVLMSCSDGIQLC